MHSCESEVRINLRWYLVEIRNITAHNAFILKLKGGDDEGELIEYKSTRLLMKKSSALTSEHNNSQSQYAINQKIEFYSDNKWIEGYIKAQKGLFYLISFIDQDSNKCNKILGLESIRESTSMSNCITLDLDKCIRLSLKNWGTLTYSAKKVNKLIEKLSTLLKDSITYIFAAELTLFVFGEGIEVNLLNELIDVAYNHFIDLDKNIEANANSKSILNKEAIKNNNVNTDTNNNYNGNSNGNVYKETLIIERLIYDKQKPKLDQLKKTNSNLKYEFKTTKNINEIKVTISSKEDALLQEAKSLLSITQKYVTIPLKQNDPFFSPNTQNDSNFNTSVKNLQYYASLYEITDYDLFKAEDNSTTIRLIGKSEMIDYFIKNVNCLCEKNDLIKEKENTIAQINHQILNLS